MSRVIKTLVEKAVKEIESELKTTYKDIEDFTTPITKENLQEKIDGRLSSENLLKNGKRRLELENEKFDLDNFIYHNQKLMK